MLNNCGRKPGTWRLAQPQPGGSTGVPTPEQWHAAAPALPLPELYRAARRTRLSVTASGGATYACGLICVRGPARCTFARAAVRLMTATKCILRRRKTMTGEWKDRPLTTPPAQHGGFCMTTANVNAERALDAAARQLFRNYCAPRRRGVRPLPRA